MANNFVEVQAHLETLVKLLGLRPPVDPGPLKELYNAKRYTDLVRYIRDSLSLDIGVRVGYVTSGGQRGASLWVTMPTPMPMYGTEEFRNAIATIHIRNQFIEREPFEFFIAGIAHELSHVVLNALKHPLRYEERAVDLTAMVLGYRQFIVESEYNRSLSFLELRSSPRRFIKQVFARMRGLRLYTRLGYLTPAEARYALKVIEDMGTCNKKSAL